MKLLAIDTAARLCAACVFDAGSDAVTGRAVRDIGKGHAEHLMAVVEDALEQAETGFSGLDCIAVSVGPGSFTGVRVGVSAARGFALALEIPSIGVTTLEAIAAAARAAGAARPVLSVLEGGREEIHLALYDEAGRLCDGPRATTIDDAATLAGKHGAILAGSAAARVAGAAAAEVELGPTAATADIAFYARIAAGIAAGKEGRPASPRPVYLRTADARPQSGFVLPRQRH